MKAAALIALAMLQPAGVDPDTRAWWRTSVALSGAPSWSRR